ncbi:MAG: ABC transporter ATP-binding protein [Termitinemataceae bacterium]|nr:MAG: ABC transporter ATP-binding protein [Termitinemataceae bacterium]
MPIRLYTLIIAIKDIDFSFDTGLDQNMLFDHFSLSLNSNDNPLIILGRSGCGKTTLLRIIAGLIKPKRGIICKNLKAALDETKQTSMVSFVFQEDRLLPHLSVLENVLLPLQNIFSQSDAKERARHFLSLVCLGNYVDSYPNELSGGQAQRVSIARAWAYPAPLILMDEPFKSLDIPLRISLMDAVHALMQNEERFLIAVSHDPREALYLGKRIIVLGRDDHAKSTKIMLDKNIQTSDKKLQSTSAEKKHEFISEHSVQIEKTLIDAMK